VVLGTLHRFEEARKEIQRAIQCQAPLGHASGLWKTWYILANVERESGNATVAAEAKQRAIECYLAYRNDGGENHDADGIMCVAVTQALLRGGPEAAASILNQKAADSDLPASPAPLIQALQAIVAGSRDRSLADTSDLTYTSAAEILLLIETLEKRAS
jgi:hypothetical protein